MSARSLKWPPVVAKHSNREIPRFAQRSNPAQRGDRMRSAGTRCRIDGNVYGNSSFLRFFARCSVRFFILGTFFGAVLAMLGRIQPAVFGPSRLRWARAP